MWQIVIAVTILTGPLAPPQRPYVSCIDGHIVKVLSECPPIPIHNKPNSPPVGGGGSGLLGGLLGGIL